MFNESSSIVGRSIYMLRYNPLNTLKVGLPLLIATAIPTGSGDSLWFFVVTILSIGAWSWTSVNWNRYIFLDEVPQGWAMPFHKTAVVQTIWTSLKITTIGIVVAIALAIPFAIFISQAEIDESFSIYVMVGIMVIVLIVTLTRFLILFPAAAIGRNLTLKEVRQATEPAGWIAPVALILISLVALGVNALAFPLVFILPLEIVQVVSAPFVFAGSMLTISFASTLYGVYVEGREID